MTHLLNDEEPQGMGAPRSRLWTGYDTPLLQDFWETFTLLWAQTIRPAWKAFQAVIVTLLGQAKSQVSRQFQRHAAQSVQSEQRRKTAALAETVNLSSESSLSLRRIQGALSDNWADARHVSHGVYLGKTNRWAQSRRRVTPVSTQSPAVSPGKSKSNTGNAPAEHEEILGLDDIFTGPVPGLFAEEAPNNSRTTAPASKKAMNRPKEITPLRAVEHEGKTGMQMDKKPPVFDESIRKRVRWPNEVLPVKVTVASFQSDSNANYADKGFVPVEPELSSELLSSELYGEAETGAEWFSMLEEPAVSAFNGAGTGGPRHNSDDETPVRDEQAPITEARPADEPLAQTSPINPAEPKVLKASPEPKSNVVEMPVKPVKAVAPEPVVPEYSRDAFPVYQPLEDEDSGFNIMVRNNRILSNSISNLVDSYFKRAALDEEPNYY
ncbi:MAG: hypothetical protein K0Q50_2531 [Vampirovibrio sp.]|nr:hypothetical protein [Vampirovibrio sp.]